MGRLDSGEAEMEGWRGVRDGRKNAPKIQGAKDVPKEGPSGTGWQMTTPRGIRAPDDQRLVVGRPDWSRDDQGAASPERTPRRSAEAPRDPAPALQTAR